MSYSRKGKRSMLATRSEKLRARAIGASSAPKYTVPVSDRQVRLGRRRGPRPEQKPRDKK